MFSLSRASSILDLNHSSFSDGSQKAMLHKMTIFKHVMKSDSVVWTLYSSKMESSVAMQKLILEKFRSQIRKIDLEKYSKSSQKSQELRKNGNNCFCKCQYKESVKFYNRSLLTAPLGSKEFYFALANRAAGLFHLSRYEDALKDIENALKNGYPLESAGKLLQKQEICRARLKNQTSQTKSTQESPTKCEEFLHSDLRIVDTKGKGKGLSAVKKIPNGTCILVDRAVSSSLSPDYYESHCYHCLRYLDDLPVPCQSCNQVSFCDRNCQELSWTQYHECECKYLDYFQFTEHFHYSPRIATKLLLRFGVKKCLQFHRNQKSTENLSKSLLKDYFDIYNMIEHSKDGNDYRLFTLKIIAFLMENNGCNFQERELGDLQEILVKHFRQIQVNAIAIHHREIVPSVIDETMPQIVEKEIGCGLFLKFRYINHCCKPNSVITNFDGDTLTMESLVDISSGQEVLHAYGVHYKYQVKSIRQKLLKESYFFTCECEACVNKMQPLNKAFLCPECSGPAICDGSIVCLECNKMDHIDVENILFQAEPCIKLIQIDESELCTDILRLKMVEKALLDSFLVLSKILYKTHLELIKVMRKLIFCWMKMDKKEKTLKFSQRLIQLTEQNFDSVDINVLNDLLLLLHSYHLYTYDEESPEYISFANKLKSLTKKLFPPSSKIPKTILTTYDLI